MNPKAPTTKNPEAPMTKNPEAPMTMPVKKAPQRKKPKLGVVHALRVGVIPGVVGVARAHGVVRPVGVARTPGVVLVRALGVARVPTVVLVLLRTLAVVRVLPRQPPLYCSKVTVKKKTFKRKCRLNSWRTSWKYNTCKLSSRPYSLRTPNSKHKSNIKEVNTFYLNSGGATTATGVTATLVGTAETQLLEN